MEEEPRLACVVFDLLSLPLQDPEAIPAAARALIDGWLSPATPTTVTPFPPPTTAETGSERSPEASPEVLRAAVDVDAVVHAAVAAADELDTFLARLPREDQIATGRHGVCFGGDGTLVAFGSLEACADGRPGIFLAD